MNLCICDLDGTLTNTSDIDNECFVEAWNREFGIDASNLDWACFRHVSDTGIATALCEKHFSTAERHGAYDRVRTRFLNLLATAASERPASFRAVHGAVEMVDSLAARGWGVIVATGAWAESARIKLAAAGFGRHIPISSSDCCVSREDIVRHAMQIAEIQYRCRFNRTVLVGDAPWDVAAAANLQLPFVGIASTERATRLQALGVVSVLPDYSDLAALDQALNDAQIP